MSGQYSSRLGASGAGFWSRTARPSIPERISWRSSCSLVTTVPSGRIIRTGGAARATLGGSTKLARQSKRRAHLRGFLALATLPVAGSRRAYTRSPSSPCSVTSVAFSSSPIMDLTGYRQRDTTEPTSFCAAFDMLHLSRLLDSGLASQVRDAERYAQRCAPCRE